ncbi:hypothetical protein HME7025_01957 [Aquirufa nivalisilvae]|uniref:Uncharacterized protein n=1 Tax=Aquirufa nivalisilvae TaxID=2516557 RepID=A0A2S2DWR3_9BACT|nr:hypothetical protein HME7025_01957 [Aquirufa nivalisilvae]
MPNKGVFYTFKAQENSFFYDLMRRFVSTLSLFIV